MVILVPPVASRVKSKVQRPCWEIEWCCSQFTYLVLRGVNYFRQISMSCFYLFLMPLMPLSRRRQVGLCHWRGSAASIQFLQKVSCRNGAVIASDNSKTASLGKKKNIDFEPLNGQIAIYNREQLSSWRNCEPPHSECYNVAFAIVILLGNQQTPPPNRVIKGALCRETEGYSWTVVISPYFQCKVRTQQGFQ